ncbi:MAG: thermonuclease family protein [Saprospiraceae bacterium]
MKFHCRILFLSLLVFIGVSCNSNSDTQRQEKSDSGFAVKKISDGDTFWIYNGTGEGEKIRLIGVDAPESRNVFKKKQGYYGKEAKVYLTNLLKGKHVKLEFDVDRLDQYGRTLAYVYLIDGTFVNEALVKNGYAMVMTVPPNVKYADLFLKLQIEARENNRGLWKQ